MKLPRGVSGDRVIRMLKYLGYSEIHQKGSFGTRDRRLTQLPSRCTIP